MADPSRRTYFESRRKELEMALSDALNEIVAAQPDDPLRFLADLAARKSGSATVSELQAKVSMLESQLTSQAGTAATAGREGASTDGDSKTSNAENKVAFTMGALKHMPPKFVFFDPTEAEFLPVIMKEIKLPQAAQTHEVCYEPLSRSVFVSQMSNSVLVRMPLAADGLLVDDQDAWRVGEQDAATGNGISGMHNISLSYSQPGCIWISLQFSNELLLVDAKSLSIKKVIQVPTLLNEGGQGVRVGGPHCMRECPWSGEIWVGLKGSVSCHPGETVSSADFKGFRRLKAAMRRACCEPGTLRAYMALLEKNGYDTPPPEGWAVWRCDPSKYDPAAADGAKGGKLYKCSKSPPMLCTDSDGGCWVPQDGVDTLLHIPYAGGPGEQLKVPFPASGSTPRITGPAIGRAPDGALWMTQLGSYCALVRIDPKTKSRELYEFGGPAWAKSLRLIHLDFSSAASSDAHNRIYALSSDLLEDDAVNALVVLRMDSTWRKCLGRRVIPLPTQDCACHRVAFIEDPHSEEGHGRSVVITEMASSKLLQIKVKNLTKLTLLQEAIHIDADGFEVHTHTDIQEEEGDRT